jgi:calcineurin-like phosphoesterase family protein
MTVFFTSDTHYYHKNIIKYSKRPFKDVEEMNDTLIKNYNKVVGSEDICYHLGDFGFSHPQNLRTIIKALPNLQAIILGNHDDAHNFRGIVPVVKDYLEIKVPDSDAKQGIQRIVLFHYSMRVWNQSHRGAWQLYGHSHGTLFDDPTLLSTDVGVDPMKYFPVSYEQLKERFKLKTFKPIDHHGADKE